ncbi:unnamed protein product, partial [Rotaria magnacalcarata]
LEQLKRARQGGPAACVEQPAATAELDEENDDYESEPEDYEDIKPAAKRKSSNSHQKDSK